MKYLIQLLLLVFFGGVLHAQTEHPKSYIPPSPTAAGLGIYGQVPVSEYSGIPDIHVPLFTVQVNDYSLPLTLNYHSAGFKNADEASWVGLGWSFTGGGVITRSKRHLDDLGPNGYYSTTTNRPCKDDYDQEPDVFYYNTGKYNGKFVLDGPSNGNPFTIRYFSKDNVKIEFNALTSVWTLTTPEGVKYRFAKTEYTTDETVITSGKGDNKTETYISSWFLSDITLVSGEKISFSYLASNTTEMVRTFRSSVKDHMTNYSPSGISPFCCFALKMASQTSVSSSLNTIRTKEVVLSQIDFPNGRITMFNGTRTDLQLTAGTAPAKKLDSLQVFSKQGGNYVYLKSYGLTYDYFNSGSGSAPHISTRLRLTSVTERTSQVMKPFKFIYPSTYMRDKNSYTGFTDTEGLIQSIQYPTGGSTVFTFESHPTGGGARIQKIYSLDPGNKLDVRRFEYTGGKLMGKIMSGYSVPYAVTPFQVDSSCCGVGNGTSVFVNREVFIDMDFSTLGETVNGCVVGYDKVVTYYGENGENGKKESFFENVAPPDPNYHSGLVMIPVPLNVPLKDGLLNDEITYKYTGSGYTPVEKVHNDYEVVNTVNITGMRRAYEKCSEYSYVMSTAWVRTTAETTTNYDMNGLNPYTETKTYSYDNPDNALPTRIATLDSRGNTLLTTNYYSKEKSVQSGGVYTTMLNKNMLSQVIDQKLERGSTLVEMKSTEYRDWYGNGRVLKPATEQFKRGANAAEVMLRYKAYDEQGNVLAVAKDTGKALGYIWGYNNTYPIAEVENAEPQLQDQIFTASRAAGGSFDVQNPQPSTSQPFTTNIAQTLTYTVRVILQGPNPTGNLSVTLYNSDGGIVHYNNYYSANTYTETVALPGGTNSYYFIVRASSISGNTIVRVDVTAVYSTTRPHASYFHTSFEELTTGTVADGVTGVQCFTGPYSVIMPYTPGKYILSWWQKPAAGGTWTYTEQQLDITATNSADYVIGASGTLLDEVRLYPANALMTTYTYQPLVGMTSKCDQRSKITYYEYDELKRLKIVRDHDRNILKTYEYNYKNY